MAQKKSITYISDLTGKEITDNDAPTVQFGWDGTDYTIDLTSAEAEKMHKALEPYLSVATKVTKSGGRKTSTKSKASGPLPAEVRAWAESNGVEVPARGRIPQSVYDAYNSAS